LDGNIVSPAWDLKWGFLGYHTPRHFSKGSR